MEARREYRHRLVALEDSLLRAGEGYRSLLSRATHILLAAESARVADILATDDALDGLAAHIRGETMELIALQSPVAGELRVLSAILHVDMMLERLGELAINVARSAGDRDPSSSEPLMQQLAEMGTTVDGLISRSLQGFTRRRGEVTELTRLDDYVDRLRDRVQERLIQAAEHEPQRIDWAIRMALAATSLERAGDMAVAIARQTEFMVSGKPPGRISNGGPAPRG